MNLLCLCLLAAVVRNTFVEGCISETLGAALALAAAARDAAVDPDEYALMVRIADEARHAALAWQTVAWALRGGDDAVSALRAAAIAARSTPQDDVSRAAWRDVIEPTLDVLLNAGT